MKVEYSVEEPLNREPRVKDLVSQSVRPEGLLSQC